ncbi:O-antigen ligase like membrane protein [Parapedobacter luteus]|uniref:O-antigen ligase like membrane protein n=1 Tax=Parapedobacter luteus TaxID=623280 RepID=A0A1T5BI92_9SPHI|nr:O-antigen ligase family protein [Parapedobacter luteus]SKB46729.1 O-antigen ligase like membrane protein [Parapedobacter luteus]
MIQHTKTITAAHRAALCEVLFCMALLAVFVPVKGYPLVFLLASLSFFVDTPALLRHAWVWFLLVFTGYASFIFFMNMPAGQREMTNFLKLPVNFTYLYFAVGWVIQRDNSRLLRWVDITLHLALGLSLLQLISYHYAADFRWIGGAPTSAHGSALYRPSHYFWGLDDKNMFGARIALIGFVYILLPVVRQRVIVWWRIAAVLLLAWLSLSRTPVVALFLGVFCLLWAAAAVRWRMVLALAALSVLPFVAEKVVRIDNITASNDGMGVRLVYWKAFFQHFTAISPLGNGFMAGSTFLGRHAEFYHGEPHIHNTFLSCYLDFGVIGFFSYVLFLGCFFHFCHRQQPNRVFWWVAWLPLLAIMMILYSGYDNDIILYLVLVCLLGCSRPIDMKQLNWRAV